MASQTSDPGMYVSDLAQAEEFANRPVREHAAEREAEALRRLARVFADQPEDILQELVDTALELCEADSSGISLREGDKFRWIVTAGKFSRFVNGGTPRDFSPCGTCLDRNAPQLFRVNQTYYDYLGIIAEPVEDGILIPWRVDDTEGTIWVVSHSEAHRFDREDYRLVQSLSDFSAIAIRHRNNQAMLMEQEKLAAVTKLVNELAHRINNPLQSLTNLVYLASKSEGAEAKALGREMSADLTSLTDLVKRILTLPT
ncbi:MAG: GAF domain-containing protein [Candidatus Korobacteraceae bacterium]